MEKNLVGLLKDFKHKLENITVKNSKKTQYIKDLDELIKLYSGLKVPENSMEKYNELIKECIELNEGENYRNMKKIDRFLPQCYYLYYEIRGEIRSIMKKLSYSFIITCILFLFVSFPIFPPLLTVLFFAPMFIGIRGLSKGLSRGVTIGMSVIEFSALTGLIAIAYVAASLTKYSKFIDELIKQYTARGYTFSATTMNFAVIIYSLMAIGLLCISIISIFYNHKYKKIFS